MSTFLNLQDNEIQDQLNSIQIIQMYSHSNLRLHRGVTYVK